VSSADRLPNGLLRAMRVAVANAYELYHLPPSTNATALDFISLRNELAMLTTLQQLIMSRISKLGGDAEARIAVDRKRLVEEKDTLSWNTINAIRYRIGQRTVLVASLALTRDMMHRAVSRPSSISVTDISMPQSSSTTMSSYVQWCAANKTECHLDFSSSLSSRVLGQPVFTSQPIQRDGIILSAPYSSLLSADAARLSSTFAPRLELIQG
jgi:hypothetical protein